MQVVSTIRQRNQLTIPNQVVEKHAWAKAGSAVTIKTTDKQIIVEPYKAQEEYDWNKIWAAVKRARSIRGMNKTSLSEFIIKDRETHF